jgi:hypothetical protein
MLVPQHLLRLNFHLTMKVSGTVGSIQETP